MQCRVDMKFHEREGVRGVREDVTRNIEVVRGCTCALRDVEQVHGGNELGGRCLPGGSCCARDSTPARLSSFPSPCSLKYLTPVRAVVSQSCVYGLATNGRVGLQPADGGPVSSSAASGRICKRLPIWSYLVVSSVCCFEIAVHHCSKVFITSDDSRGSGSHPYSHWYSPLLHPMPRSCLEAEACDGRAGRGL